MGHANVNLYQRLGVGREDGAGAVRRAYRDLARLSQSATDSVPAFVQEIELACEVLSDGARRARYDRQLVRDDRPPGRPGPRAADIDLLHDFEGGPPSREEVRNTFRRNFAAGAEPKSALVEVLELRIRLAPTEAQAAEVIDLAVPVFHACAECHGTGAVDWCECRSCGGAGLREDRHVVRVTTAGDRVISLESLGVRSPVLALRLIRI